MRMYLHSCEQLDFDEAWGMFVKVCGGDMLLEGSLRLMPLQVKKRARESLARARFPALHASSGGERERETQTETATGTQQRQRKREKEKARLLCRVPLEVGQRRQRSEERDEE